MKKKVLLIAVALTLALGACVLAGCGSKEDTAKKASTGTQAIKDAGELRVGVKVDVPGFGYKDPKTNEIDGFEVDLARAIAKKIIGDDTKIKLEPVTAKTRGPLLDNGQLDLVIATFTIKPERLEQWNFSQPYYTDQVGLLVKKNGGIKSLKDLDGKTIGVAQGATTKDAIEAEIKAQGLNIKPKFSELATYPEINAALESGRVNAFSVDKSILLGYLNDEKVILDEGFAPQEYGIAAKKGNDDLTKTVDEVLAELQSSGEMDKLLQKWNLNK